MSLSIQELLENKGIQVKKDHFESLQEKWEGIQALRGNLEGVNIDDADISLKNIPGGDHIDE
ncbi:MULTISPECIES: hypothetical protein [Viridibacillus]|uniref:Uncharacterized protein n=1 Tax=Viridibacillus arenosi FSL R5-213 TaxID=1227360 RepID=W4EMP3_9BACL|nr:hypothetical protein C176_18627 [Viridibacillus arenosi FSL R5-213]OMC80018.1 hypothetical protein BK130_18230 [Viridibacillus sp. FSL H8-0123]OMC84300.1 hypothetical protein BK128_17130 [Viridibacillus sp. FSL H7-0596]OMC89700.1 hypothetical protein BK137_16630 [Viridibacillus arenosi]